MPFRYLVMKKFLLSVVVALLTVSAQAQKAPGTFTIYPRVGMNFSKFSGDKIYTAGEAGGHVDAKFKTGFAFGAEIQYQISNPFALSAGVLYSQQGTKFEEIKGVDEQLKIKHDNIIVPLMFVVTTKYGFSAKMGLQPEFRVSDEFDAVLNKVNLSLPVGIAYEYRNICLDLRYVFGLTNVYKDQSQNDTSRNGTIMLTLGYGIDL